MKYLFVNYPKCSTCAKAKKWLEENGVDFDLRHIVENNPTKEELKKWITLSGQPIKKFFNTSGI
ncbi:glutaredoxin domain-containing protein, partial [Cetobacterium sp.]|uniref:glutaredoxin domain-containing protein n=1 Tax=Cetobacterium sp. TaxID=2071632 RepID=UPI002FCAE369